MEINKNMQKEINEKGKEDKEDETGKYSRRKHTTVVVVSPKNEKSVLH